MNIVVATDRRWGIGKDGKLPWHIPEDLKRFKELTMGKVVVMGRKTLESLPNGTPLKNRINIVLTSNRDYKADGCIIVHNEEELQEALKAYNTDDVFVIGGSQIYNLLLQKCSKAFVTRIDSVFETDAKFPNLYSMKCWEQVYLSDDYESNGLKYNFGIFTHVC